MPNIEFCFVVETGVLEQQAILLCESIRRFAGPHADAMLTVISPRSARRPSAATIARLLQLGAAYVPLELDSPTPEYGPSYRTLALGWRARQNGPDVLVQLDSDTLFLDAPDLALNDHIAMARPVDVKGMCSGGPGDRFEPVWLRMCAVCDVDIDRLGYVRSTVDKRKVRASFNAGLVVARRFVFELIAEFFSRIAAAGIRPFLGQASVMRTGSGQVSPAGHEMWGTTQAAISLAVARLGSTVRNLAPDDNIPLHLWHRLDPLPERVAHLHYHWLFADAGACAAALAGLPLRPEQAAWLRSRLPLGTADLATVGAGSLPG